jgi:predicted membrane channel-forming protein YqfA (hemolysin III family)
LEVEAMNIEDYKKYRLDIKRTMYANIAWFFLAILVFVFIIITFNFVANIEDPTTQLIALIVYFLAVVKLLVMIGYPNLEYELIPKKPRRKPNETKMSKL